MGLVWGSLHSDYSSPGGPVLLETQGMWLAGSKECAFYQPEYKSDIMYV